MTPTYPDIAAIARGLTKAQREAIQYASIKYGDIRKRLRTTCPIGTKRALVRLGLIENEYSGRLTVLGVYVRAALEQETACG